MSCQAPIRRFAIWRAAALRAPSMLALLMMILTAMPARADITAAEFQGPTDRYAHGVLGDAIEWGALSLTTDDNRKVTITLPLTRVFEDLKPRLITTLQGKTLAMVVETDMSLGARLSLYDENGLFAATPHIGQSNRWLAPIGAADLDGDGTLEIAYVDRPHLARTIRILRLQDRTLTEVGSLAGYTNHRIGEDTIAGGIRTCAGGPEMIVADAAWQSIMSITWDGRAFTAKPLGPHQGRASFAKALACN